MNRHACAIVLAALLPVLLGAALWPYLKTSQVCADTLEVQAPAVVVSRPAPAEPPAEMLHEMERLRADLQTALGLLEKSFGTPVRLEKIQAVPVTLTAYSSTPDQCDATPHITASNKPVRHGVVAVSNDLVKEMGLSFGQRVLIPGHGVFEVQDRMHPRWQRRVDIWHADREAARLFGVQKGTMLWVAEAAEERGEEKKERLIAMAEKG